MATSSQSETPPAGSRTRSGRSLADRLSNDRGGDQMLARVAAGAFVVFGVLAILGARADHTTEATRLAYERTANLTNPTERSAALEAAHRNLSGRLATGNLNATASAVALAMAPPDLDRAEEAARYALATGPAKADAWARLAYVDAVRDDTLDEEGRTALMRSYLVSPYGPPAFQRWRMEFSLAFWSQLDEPLRASALRQASVIVQDEGGRAYLDRLADTTPDQAGSLALRRHLDGRS